MISNGYLVLNSIKEHNGLVSLAVARELRIDLKLRSAFSQV